MNAFVLLVCLPVVLPASFIPPTPPTSFIPPTPPATCDYHGTTYRNGEHFQPNDCTFCNCYIGHTSCMVADCFFTQCVDSVRKPGQCCPVCPNGHNCRGPKGQIISAGKSVQVDAYTTCECPKFNRGNHAVCKMSKPLPLFS